MFRPLRRINQKLSEEECCEILNKETRAVLSLHGEDGYPYGLPMNYVFEGGKVYLHSAREGHKVDAIAKDPRVCLTVVEKGVPAEGRKGLFVRSVILFGTLRPLADPQEIRKRLKDLGKHIIPKEKAYIDEEIARSADRVCLWEMTIDHMSGKYVFES
jgi:nitroimidazol reductase NimA-like FMN-containing flavoprotein (pyridoxamine 5'-phosphate oxidase superfamily)